MTLYEKVCAERFGRAPDIRREEPTMPDPDSRDDAAEALRAYFARSITLDECAERLHAAGVERIELTPKTPDDGGRTPR